MMRLFHSGTDNKKLLKSLNKRIKLLKQYGSIEGLASIYLERADAYEQLNDHEAAIADYLQALQLGAPDTHTIQYQLGFAYYRTGQLNDAIKYLSLAYNHAMKNSNSNAKCLYLLGVISELQENEEAAHAFFKRAIKSNPDLQVIREYFNQFQTCHSEKNKAYINQSITPSLYTLGQARTVDPAATRETLAHPTLFSITTTQPSSLATPSPIHKPPKASIEISDPYPAPTPIWEKQGLEYWEYLQEIRHAQKW